MSSRWFPNIADLSVSMSDRYQSESFPSIVDLSKVTKLILNADGVRRSGDTLCRNCIDLLKRTRNIHSLTLNCELSYERDLSSRSDLHSTMIDHVDRLKLRHLNISVGNLNQVQILLKTFQDLISTRFSFLSESLTVEQIIRHVKTVRRVCSYVNDVSWVSIWLGEYFETTNSCKRIKLCHSKEDS